MESRHGNHVTLHTKKRSTALPPDYLKMIADVFTANFDAGLIALSKIRANPRFEVHGWVYGNEVVLSVTLAHEGRLAATTVHASCDFDPKASAPTAPELLAACVDAIGEIYLQILDPNDRKKLEQLDDESLSAMENVPFEWVSVQINKRPVFVKVDKSNPALDELTNEWLLKNDPNIAEREKREQEETEKLFVRGPKNPTEDDDEGSGTVH